jgi:DNA polymerase-1
MTEVAKAVYSVDEVKKALDGADFVVVDTETSSLNPYKDGKVLVGLGIRPFGGRSMYIPVRHETDDKMASMRTAKAAAELLRGKHLVFHNAKFDLAVMLQEGVDLGEEDISDTMVMARLCYEEEPSYALKELGQKFVDPEARVYEQELKALYKKAKMTSYGQIPLALMLKYAGADLELTEGLYNCFYPIIERRYLVPLFELEKRLTRALFRTEQRGFMIDLDYVRSERDRLAIACKKLLAECHELAGVEFNPKSPTDVKKIMGKLGIKSKRKTGSGADSWDKAALAMIEGDYPITEKIVAYRGADHIRVGYYENFLERVDSEGAIHCNLAQAGAKTGRFSCREPNLQNIPRFEGFTGARIGAIAEQEKLRRKRERMLAAGLDPDDENVFAARDVDAEKELFGKVRGSFIPRPGYFLGFTDWSQVELRIFADYAGETELIETFGYGLDVHRLTALAAFGELPTDPDKLVWFRNIGKQLAFGLLYGMGKKLLALELGKTEDEAEQFMAAYFARMPRAKNFIESVFKVCRSRAGTDSLSQFGFLMDRFNRRRFLPENKLYKGVNFLVQGTAADLMKDAYARVFERLVRDGLKTRPLLTVHDEIVFEVPYDEAETWVWPIVEEMEKCDKLKVPLKVDVEWSPISWGEKRKISCEKCDGFGKLLSEDQDDVLRAMYDKDDAFMANVKVEICDNCGGSGIDLNYHDKDKKTEERLSSLLEHRDLVLARV